MSKFSLEELPQEDLKALGLLKNGQLTLDRESKDAILNGRVTSLLHLKDINVDGLQIKNLDAKLSLAKKDDGSIGLYVHPILKNRAEHPDLSPEENQAFLRGGTHAKQSAAYGTITGFGSAPYQFDKQNKTSYYIELEKDNGERSQIWGVDLERALNESKKGVGDVVQLEYLGKQPVRVEIDGRWEERERYTWNVNEFQPERKKEQIQVYEFDKETNSFVAIDSDDVLVPEEVNGMPLSEQQKVKLKKGQPVEMGDGTVVQASPANVKNKFLHSNRRLLLASVLLDGGMSFALIKGVQLIANQLNKNNGQDLEYNKGYRDALAKVQADLERKTKEFPNNKEIVQDLNTVKAEYSRTATVNTYNDAEEKSINQTKGVVNDPELDDNAARTQREDHHSEHARDIDQDINNQEIKGSPGVKQEERVGRGR